MKFLGFHNCAFLLCADEIREMIERVENRGLDLKEALELEGTEDEFSKCRKSKIKYTRALLLEFTEVEICRKLPNDFDLLLLRELHRGSEGTVEHKSLIGTPLDHSPLLTTPLNPDCPGQIWKNHLSTQSKASHPQRLSSSERKEAWQPLLQTPEKYAGVLQCKIQKSDLFQLSKTRNPYRPPHLNKKIQPTFYEPGEESSGESNRKGQADDIAGNENSGCRFTLLAVADDSTKEPVGKSEAFRRKIAGHEVIKSSKPLDEYEDFWGKSEGNVVIGDNNILEGLIDDNQPTFDDFWAEILETIHLQEEPKISPMNIHADSEDEIHFPDEESLTSVDPLVLPENSNTLNLDDSNGVANSEDEIDLPDEDSLISIHDLIAPCSSTSTLKSSSCGADKATSDIAVNSGKSSKSADVANLPDEDSLISIHDMIFTCSSMPTLKSGSCETDKVTSNIAVDIRRYSKSAHVTRRNDNSKRIRLRAEPCPNLSELVSREQLHSPVPNYLLCDQTGLPPLFLTHHNNLSCTPSINNFSQSDIHLPFCPGTTLPNTETYNYLMSQYSMLQQPYIFPQQLNHPLAVYDLNTLQFLNSTSQQTAIYNYKSFEKSKTGK